MAKIIHLVKSNPEIRHLDRFPKGYDIRNERKETGIPRKKGFINESDYGLHK